MSVKVMGIVWEADLPQREKLVLLAYADHAHDDGSRVFPSVGFVAHKTGYSTRSVQRITKTMVKKEYMIQEGKTKYGTKLYRIMIDNLPMLPPYLGDDKLTGAKYGGDILTGAGVTKRQGQEGGGDNLTPSGVTPVSEGGDIAVSPKPSLTVNEPSEGEDSAPGNIFELYEESVGPLTSDISDQLQLFEKDYPAFWIEDALKITKKNKATHINYVNSILERWNQEGKDNGYQSKKKKKSEPAGFDALRSVRKKAGLDEN